MKKISIILALFAVLSLSGHGQTPAPHLQKQGAATQLRVDNRPFLILGGELGNSTASSLGDLDTIFHKLSQAGLNTALVPAYWDLIEPFEGQFDFTTIDAAINAARAHNLKIIFLWFGAWKNSMSCYAPLWVKADYKKYPRAVNKAGKPVEIMSAFSQNNIEADKKAFTALMQQIAETDFKHQTVIMIQVENEIGMLEAARDHSGEADKWFQAQVPERLIDYLSKNKKELHPALRDRWQANGNKIHGTWTEFFGEGLETDELFMAWHYGLFVEEIAAAGKKIYKLPMYLNAALNSRGRKPGDYPSAGPLAHLLDVWRASAPSIDFISPDIYDPGFTGWCAQYHVNGNPLFIPEIKFSDDNAAKVFYVFGEHDAMGFSPFSIEDIRNPTEYPVAKSYKLLRQITSLLADIQGKGKSCGFLFDDMDKERTVKMGNYNLTGKHVFTSNRTPVAGPWPEVGALVVQLSENEFLVAGTGVVITFTNALDNDMITGIGYIDRVEFVEGKMIPKCRMNGDQSHQGRHLRIDIEDWNIQYIQLYEYSSIF